MVKEEVMHTIEHIAYPWYYTDTGLKIHKKQITGNPKVNSVLDDNFEVQSGNNDDTCVGGQCPIR